ncbi:unnamed protein product [Brassica oleracea]
MITLSLPQYNRYQVDKDRLDSRLRYDSNSFSTSLLINLLLMKFSAFFPNSEEEKSVRYMRTDYRTFSRSQFLTIGEDNLEINGDQRYEEHANSLKQKRDGDRWILARQFRHRLLFSRLKKRNHRRMWKKGELVWVRLNPSDSWIPGRILDPSEPFGILVSSRFLLRPNVITLRSKALSPKLRLRFRNSGCRFVEPPIDLPYLDREISLPLSPLSSDSALSFVREMAVSRRVPLRRLAETNGSTAQILSFKRYAVDFNRSEYVYEQVIESAKLMDRAEEPHWYLDLVSYLSLRDPLPKDIHCCSVDKVVQSWNTRSPVISSDPSVMKACGTLARVSIHEGVDETDVQVEEEHKSAVEELEDRNDHVEKENKNEKDVEDEKDETSMREEEVEIDSRNSTLVGEEDLNCSIREDGEAEKLQDTIDKEAGVETSEGECGDDEEEEKAEESRSIKKVGLRKMTLGEWFKFMEVHVQKQIVEETEKMLELMRSKALRVDQYIAEQKQAMGKGRVS